MSSEDTGSGSNSGNVEQNVDEKENANRSLDVSSLGDVTQQEINQHRVLSTTTISARGLDVNIQEIAAADETQSK